MSDLVPVKISELSQTTTLSISDIIDVVRGVNNLRLQLQDLTLRSDVQTTDEILTIRSGDIARASFPVVEAKFVGEIFSIIGNARVPSSSFPAFCMTNFSGSTTINITNFIELVPLLRDQTAVYLEGQTGQVSAFAGTVSGSVITLTDTTANNAILAALEEDRLANGGSFTDWRTGDIDGTTFALSGLNVSTRAITVTGTPTTGAQNITFYPHRIAGSTTTARVHSWIGRSLIGPGTGETISGLLRRDRFQGHWHRFRQQNSSAAVGQDYLRNDRTFDTPNVTQDNNVVDAVTDGVNGTPRTGSDTHGPDVSAHMYLYGGQYNA